MKPNPKRLSSPNITMISVGRIATLAVSGGFFIIFLRYADERYRLDTSIASQMELVARVDAQQIEVSEFRRQGIAIEEELADFEQRIVGPARLGQVQDTLVKLARDHGCQLKKASPRSDKVREDRLTPINKETVASVDLANDPANQLKRHEVGLSLSIEGSVEKTQAFLADVESQPWLFTTKQFNVRRDPSHPGQIALDVEIDYQRLEKKTIAGDAVHPIAPPKA